MAKPRNGPLLRAVGAYASSVVVEWAMWAGILVYAFDRGGPTAAGVASIALLVPAALFAPVVAGFAGGPSPGRVLGIVYTVQAAALGAASGLAGARLDVVLVVAAIGVPVTAQSFVRPCMSVLVPDVVVRPDDLVAANLLMGRADAVSILVGPVLAGGLLRIGGPALVLGVCAAISVGGAALVWSAGGRRRDGALERGHEARVGRAEFVIVGRELAARRGSLQVIAVIGATFVLIGALDLVYVNLALDVFDLGDDGPALLSSCFGAGAVLGGLATGAFIRRPELAPAVIAALLVVGVALGGLAAATSLGVALVVFSLVGACRSVLDVTGRLLLQRSAPTEYVAVVFAVLELCGGLGMLIGSVLAQSLLSTVGVSGTVLGLSIAIVGLAVVLVPGLRHADEHADAPIVETQLLRHVELLAPLPGPVLERLARTATMVEVGSGGVVVTEGEVGDSYYVIADGSVAVTIAGSPIRTMARGEGFGEIALLADVPRTATVTAAQPAVLLRLDRTPFLEAVVGHDASASIAWAVARAWHPGLTGEAG